MACFIPFNNRNLDISFFAFRPTVVLFGDLIEALKHFSLCTETLGCVQSSIIQSIHGNMIIWYGAWLKKSCENKESLVATLISMLSNHVSSMAILIEHSFFDSYAGDSRDGGSSTKSAAKFCTGDTISLSIASLATTSTGEDDNDNKNTDDLSYTCLALFKSEFIKSEGVASGVCLRCQTKPAVANFYVWKSLQSCYSWILLGSNQRSSAQTFLERFPIDCKYDIFRVVYVSGDGAMGGVGLASSRQMLGQDGESNGQGQLMQN